jgi:hypothetical protein
LLIPNVNPVAVLAKVFEFPNTRLFAPDAVLLFPITLAPLLAVFPNPTANAGKFPCAETVLSFPNAILEDVLFVSTLLDPHAKEAYGPETELAFPPEKFPSTSRIALTFFLWQ